MSEPRTHFPPDFVFGVATAAYQVEGNIENDWSAWERLGKLKEPQMRCGRAVDHWNRYAGDYQLAADVGAGAFRISLEWARIEPERGVFDESALAGYRTRLIAMRAAGLQPFVTLHHFTHPKWFHEKSPWHESASVEAFRRYANRCAEILVGLDPVVLTFNEPMVLLLGGYLQGLIPPGIANSELAMAALGNMARAHVVARSEIRARLGDKVPVGTSQNMLSFAPDRAWHPIDHAIVRLAHQGYNHAFLEALQDGELRINMPGLAMTRQRIEGAQRSLDFIGLNYYTRTHLRFIPRPPFVSFLYRDRLRRGLTDIGWEDYPEGFLRLLLEVKRYGLPVWVTENGIDDRVGTRRPGYLHRHWKQILTAIGSGVDVRGYLHWSLLDNFEWLEGWGPRFGLYRVDFETLERTKTPACDYFRAVATTRELTAPRSEPVADGEPGQGQNR